MNQKLLSGFTATLLISTLGLAPSGYADQAKSASQQSGDVSQSGNTAQATTSVSEGLILNPPTPALPAGQANAAVSADEKIGENVSAPDRSSTASAAPAPSPAAQTGSSPNSSSSQPATQPVEAVKVGEYQSQAQAVTVATIQQHQLRGRDAVTLYVRNIPVLTFLSDQNDQAAAQTNNAPADSPEVKIASTQTTAGTAIAAIQPDHSPAPTKISAPPDPRIGNMAANPQQDSRDPVWRATTVAARLNQLYRDNVDANDIKISWEADRKQSVIAANEVEIVSVDDQTVLPDTVSGSDGDMLQVTNRIRRQMGGAAPLTSIEGKPDGFTQVSLGNVSIQASGYASWYGPGFEGAYSASGELFNQNAMTAAHPSLPFGTQVRVTNIDNGQSVVVRINDRGPFTHDRVIDLSAGAARIIGLIQAGVAPVSLEVLGAAQAAN